MISQADILKTLINKNCTDDAVMSTALSPDCTPPKLLEKLTEAERFDLALDISMKLGLDVIPLWRTWALRCLRHRNFQGAREKFRHCFQRLRMPSGRTSPAHSQLLTKILAELTKMDENQMSLTEEIELIKQRKGIYSTQRSTETTQDTDKIPKPTDRPILSKSKIYAECLHYLNEYGSVQDKIRFNIRNSLWDFAIQTLLENTKQINLEKFFIGEIIQYTASTGCLFHLLEAFLKADPKFSQSARYFQSIYDFCLRHKRYNLLYYVQTFIGDHIAAANTQINLFFLRKPIRNYNELSQRITNLTNARKNYQEYLEKLKHKVMIEEKLFKTSNLERSTQLFSSMSQDKVEKQIQLLDLQIEVTHNFAINEVSGCIHDIELDDNIKQQRGKNNEVDDVPVTLFEKSIKRKTILAALVLIYFDLSCTTYFSRNGLDLAKRFINDHDLDKLKVFKTAMRIIMEDESCDIFENASLLLERIREDYLVDRNSKQLTGSSESKRAQSSGTQNLDFSLLSLRDEDLSVAEKDDIRSICDEVIRDSINSCREPDYRMELAKLLSGEARIELYIEHGKLSNAQRLACNMNRADYVSRIIKEADRLNQDHVKTVCQLWLAKHETRNFIR